MRNIVHLLVFLAAQGCAQREFFLHSNASSWDAARLHCQLCYRELTPISHENVQVLLESLGEHDTAVWVGLRRVLNDTVTPPSNSTNETLATNQSSNRTVFELFNGTLSSLNNSNTSRFAQLVARLTWSHWSNGDRVTFQNWYPGRPIPKPKPPPRPTCQSTAATPTVQDTTFIPESTANTDSTSDTPFTTDGYYTTLGATTDISSSTEAEEFTTAGTTDTVTSDGTEHRSDTYTCPRLDKLLQCVEDPGLQDAIRKYITTPENPPNSQGSDDEDCICVDEPATESDTAPTSTIVPDSTSTSSRLTASSSDSTESSAPNTPTGLTGTNGPDSWISGNTLPPTGTPFSSYSSPTASDSAATSSTNLNSADNSDSSSSPSAPDTSRSLTGTNAPASSSISQSNLTPTGTSYSSYTLTTPSDSAVTASSNLNSADRSDVTMATSLPDTTTGVASHQTSAPSSVSERSSSPAVSSTSPSSYTTRNVTTTTRCVCTPRPTAAHNYTSTSSYGASAPTSSNITSESSSATPAQTISTSTAASTATPANTTTTANPTITATTALPTSIPTSDVPATTVSFGSTSTPCVDEDLEDDFSDFEEFIEEACLALLSIGMWWERVCSEELPYICYDDRFHGEVNVSNITYTSANLSWLEAPGPISDYRVEVSSDSNSWNETTTSELNTTLTNLTAGTQYTVQVFPIKCERDLNPQTTQFYTGPGHIQNLTISDIQETSVTLSWSPPAHGRVDFYQLCIRNSSSAPTYQNTSLPRKTIYNLEPATNYTVEVSAEVADMSIRGHRFNKIFYTRPSGVRNLTVTNHTNSTLTIGWKKPVGYSSSYTYHVTVTNPINPSLSNSKTTSSVSESFSDLKSGTKFVILVLSQIQGHDGILNGSSIEIQGYTNPNPVRSLSVSVTGQDITAKWEAPDPHEKFLVKLLVDGAPPKEKNTTETYHTFRGLSAGAQYTVVVYVKGIGDLTSTGENQSIFTLPNEPRNLQIGNKNKTCISLNWDAPEKSEGVTIHYDLIYTAKFWDETNKTETDSTSYTWCGLRSGTTFDFYVSVFAGKQNSENITKAGKTDPNVRNVTLSILCSSGTSGQCKVEASKDELLDMLKTNLTKRMEGVYLDLKKLLNG